MGLLAIATWSTTLAVSRSLTEDLGRYTTAMLIYLIGGACACALLTARPGAWRAMLGLSRRYLLVCGALFVVYVILLYAAVGAAPSRAHAAVAGLINYLWPAFTLLFSVPLLGKRARWTLWPGLALAVLGIAVACAEDALDGVGSPAGASSPALSYACAGAAAICWGLYSNLSRRWGGTGPGAVPLFLLACGLALIPFWLGWPEPARWSPRAAFELAFMALLNVALAYWCWDRAVRAGNLVFLAALSFFIPIASTLITTLYLDIHAGWQLWAGACLVTAGAVVCHRSFVKETGEA